MNSLEGTQTANNLMNAFAGESQAATRYAHYSSIAYREGYVEIASIFKEISEQEKAHSKVFLEYLSKDFNGKVRDVAAGYPVGLSDTKNNLIYSAEGEAMEWGTLYPNFSKIAKEEGFEDIAKSFKEIAEIEETHEKRFRKLHENIINNKVFSKDVEVEWECLNCGYIHKGKDAPDRCPACSYPKNFFAVVCRNQY